MCPEARIPDDSIITADLVDETLDNEWNGRGKFAKYVKELNKIEDSDEIVVEFDESDANVNKSLYD